MGIYCVSLPCLCGCPNPARADPVTSPGPAFAAYTPLSNLHDFFAPDIPFL